MSIQLSKVLFHPLLVQFNGASDFGYKNNQRLIGICEVIDTAGMSGFGEIYASSYFPPDLTSSIIDNLSSGKLHQSFNTPMEFYKNLSIPFVSQGGLIETLIGGIDIAVWDLFLKSKKVTLSSYLGVTRLNMPKLYFSSGSNYMKAHEIERECTKISTRFSGYKLRVGLNESYVDMDRVDAAASNLNPGHNLMIDAIMSTNPNPWALPNATEMVKSFSVKNPIWIEEPLHPNNLAGYAEICQNFPGIIACGEALISDVEFQAYESINDLGFIQLDATQNGGLTKTLKILDRIATQNQSVTMHVWGSKLAFNLNYQIAQLYPFISWVEFPGYTMTIDQMMGDSSLQESMVGFSNLKTLSGPNFQRSWSGDAGIHRIK
jgi:L-alanine-DL-glutamate epimerase-like enolase superfamily enzyme